MREKSPNQSIWRHLIQCNDLCCCLDVKVQIFEPKLHGVLHFENKYGKRTDREIHEGTMTTTTKSRVSRRQLTGNILSGDPSKPEPWNYILLPN